MSNFINKNGKFNHGKWLREQTLNELKYGLLGMTFDDEFSEIIEQMDGEIMSDLKDGMKDGRLDKGHYNKIDKLWNKMKKDQQSLSKLLNTADDKMGNN
tara:strand:- start:3996 stop:4292 length:297 start_codon:yes stop_codon:yes gene_type:complete